MTKLKELNVSLEQKTMLLYQPHMIALSCSLKHYDTENSPAIAMTDGYRVYYNNIYKNLPQNEKNFIFIHELMHGVFKHPTRIMLMKLQLGVVYFVLANYAADAIINEGIIADDALRNNQSFTMPKEFPGITMKSIHEIIEEVHLKTGKAYPASYDPKALHGQQMEVIYSWLVWAKATMEEERESAKNKNQGQSQGQGQNSDQDQKSDEKSDGKSSDDQGGEAPNDETKIEKIMRTEDPWDLKNAKDEIEKALKSGKTISEIIDEANAVIDKARADIAAVAQSMKLQGLGQGNLLLNLENDMPKAVIPWNRILRKLLVKGLNTKVSDSYTRLGSATRAGLVLNKLAPYQPGTTIFSEQPRVLVVLDVSGSHVNQIQRCFSEIWSITKMKGAAVDIITFDDGVQEIMEIRNKSDFKKIIKKGLQGGGGTCMSGVMNSIKETKVNYKAMIVMTDGYLYPPEDTKMEIIWMITPGGTTEGLSKSGKVINLPEYL